MDEREYLFKKVYWHDVCDEVRAVNAPLAEIIDKLDPDRHYPLIKCNYRFGDLIVKDGITQLPTLKSTLPLNDSEISPKIRELLSYSKIPLAMLLDKASEVFVYEDNRIIPLNIFYSGKLFGTFETLSTMFGLESNPIWCVSAGGRLIFTLPQLHSTPGFNRLRTFYNLPSNLITKTLFDQWYLFKHIATHPKSNDSWNQQMLLFTKPWFSKQTDWFWLKFREYIFKEGWIQSQYAVAKFEFGLLWQQFARAMANRNLKLSTYLSDTIKYLLAVGIGAAPAVVPSIDNEIIAPMQSFKNALLNVYELKEYWPTMMQSGRLTPYNQKVYYSLNYPTLLEGSPNGTKSQSFMLDLKVIKLAFETLALSEQKQNNFDLNKINLDYFHVELDKFSEIKSSVLITQTDDRFQWDQTTSLERRFCATSPFWRGVISIAHSL